MVARCGVTAPAHGPRSSSDDAEAGRTRELTKLVGSIVEDVKIELPGWDLMLAFSNGLALRVFCDHVPGDPSFSDNWELCRQEDRIVIGVGSICEIEPRAAPSS